MRYVWLLPLLLLVGCSKPKEAEKEAEPVISVTSAVAGRKTIHDLLPLDGAFVLAANDYAKLAPQASGKIAGVLVKEGDSVRKGQVLARLDISVQAAQQQSAAAGLGVAEAQAAQANAGLKASQADYLASVKAAQLALESARIDRDSSVADAKNELQKVRAGARPQEITQAEQAVRQAEVNANKAKVDADRDAALLKEGYVSGQQADASAAAYQLAVSALTSAKSELDLVKAGARPEELKAAELHLSAAQASGDKKVQAAQAALDQAKAGQLSVNEKEKEAEAARLGAAQKGADARAASSTTAYGVIRAPFDGVVTRILHGVGESVDSTSPVLEVAKKGALVEFAGLLSPSQAQKVSAGMAVEFGDSIGTVKAVGIADSVSGQAPVRVAFGKAPAGVVAGLPSRIEIELASMKNAISVPDGAVVTRDDKKVVFVIEKGEASMKEVEVGPSEGGFTVISKGLAEGDKVVLVGQHEISDGAKVEEASDDAKDGDPKADSKAGDEK